MKSRFFLFAILFSFLLILGSCGGGSSDSDSTNESTATTETAGGESSSDNEVKDPAQQMKEASAQMKEAMEALQGTEAGEVIDFRELKKMLPETLLGMPRVNHSGEKVGAMGMKMSNAKASYQSGDKRLEVNIVDFAGIPSLKGGLAAWSLIDIDRETEEEIERTTVKDGNKAFETFNYTTKKGQLNLIVNDRFVVDISGTNIEFEDLEKAWRSLGMNNLQ